MSFVIFFITILFICIAFFSPLPVDSDGGLGTYLFVAYRFIGATWLVSLITCLGLAGFFMFTQTFAKHYSLLQKFTHSLFHVGSVMLLGFFLSYLTLFLIAFLQLNIFSLFINIHPQSMGLQTDRAVIAQTIKTQGAPFVVISDNDTYHQLIALATATTGADNYYGKHILSTLPSFLVLPMRDFGSSVLLIDDTLVISGIEQKDIQVVAPVLGHAFLSEYFWRRKVRGYPDVRVMGRSEYAVYRKADAKKRLSGVEKTLEQIEGGISTTSAQIETTKVKITDSQSLIEDAPDLMNQEYKICLAARVKAASPSATANCRTIVTAWNNRINTTKKDIVKMQDQITFDQEQLKLFTAYKGDFSTQINVLKTRQSAIPFELGLFEPKERINIVLLDDKQHRLKTLNYLQTYTHEYLHYASYISEKKQMTDGFFEEALTEYFARKIIEDRMGIKTNFGYPIQTKIMEEMMRKIPESDMADIYFAKDNATLERTLNNVYGDNFYRKNQILLATLQYTSNQAQALQVANEIMKRIGGPKVKQEDFISTMN